MFFLRKNSVLTISLTLAVFSIAVQSFAAEENDNVDNEIIIDVIKLNIERWNKIQSIRVDYDLSRFANSNLEYQYSGNYWEKEGDQCRYYYQRKDLLSTLKKDGNEEEIADFCVEGFGKENCRYELLTLKDSFPPVNITLCDQRDSTGNITEFKTKQITYDRCPLLEYIPVLDETSPITIEDFLTRDYHRVVNVRQDDSGDKVVEIESDVTGTDTTNKAIVRTTFNLSKGGILTQYTLVNEISSSPSSYLVSELLGKNFKEVVPGLWFPQTLEAICHTGDRATAKSVGVTNITNISINNSLSAHIKDFSFPEHLIVHEFNQKTEKSLIHIWGKNKPAKTFDDASLFVEYFGENCHPSSENTKNNKAIPIYRIVLAILGAILITTAFYIKNKNVKQC